MKSPPPSSQGTNRHKDTKSQFFSADTPPTLRIMAPRGSAWRPEEVTHLLTCMEEVVPLNSDDWDRVKELHDEQFARKNRSVVALTRKFQQLYRTSEPTGDPNIPPDVEWALNIREMMREKADGTTGSFHEDENVGEEVGEEEDVDLFEDVLEEEEEESERGTHTENNNRTSRQSARPTAAAATDTTPVPRLPMTSPPATSTTFPATTTATAPRRSPPTLPTSATTNRFNQQLQGMRGQKKIKPTAMDSLFKI